MISAGFIKIWFVVVVRPVCSCILSHLSFALCEVDNVMHNCLFFISQFV